MKTMLIVDDMPAARYIVKRMVESLDVEIIGEAENGIEAVEKYKELKPDIVIMDNIMRKMTGLEALKEIIEYDPGAAVIIISSTGEQVYVIDEALALGARGVFSKPIQRSLFVAAIKRLLD